MPFYLLVVPCETKEAALELATKLNEHTSSELNTVVTPGAMVEFMEKETDNTLVQLHFAGWSLAYYDVTGDADDDPSPVVVIERSRPDGSTATTADAPTSGT